MGKRRAHEQQANFDLPEDLLADLKEMAKKIKMKRKEIAELALRRWINDRKAKEVRA